MKIAILGAMAEEITPFLAELKNYRVIDYANNQYYKASYGEHELIIAYSKIGKVFSALTASAMIQRFGAEILLFSGVAGGLSDNINVGDLVLATKTVQHDVDITAFGQQPGAVPGSSVEIETDSKLCQIAEKVAMKGNIELKKGVIATGDQFIHDPTKKDYVKNTFNAAAVEMEGASVNLICNELGVPCMLLRAISDTADGQAVEDFASFVKQSAKRSADFILQVINDIKAVSRV